jgi:thioredoxin 1
MFLSIGESNFDEEVIQASRPVLVSFWAPWCSPCRMVEPMLQQLQAAYAPNLKLVRVNADENFRLARSFNLKSVPTVLIFQDGELLSQRSLQGDRTHIKAVLGDLLTKLPVMTQ